MAAAEGRERRLAIAGAALAAMAVAVLGMGVIDGGRAPVVGRTEVLATAKPSTQAEVAAFVGTCNASTDTEQLRAMAHHEDPLLAGNAIRALGRLRAVHGDPKLLAMLHDGRPRVRGEVVLALGASAEPAMAVHLQPLLADPDEGTAMLAVQALVQLGVSAPVQALSAELAASPRLRQFASAALGTVRVQPLLAATAGLNAR